MVRQVCLRFAPSPTGPLHIGGVRTALYNYLFAKQHNGRFILRIEDTDQARKIDGAEKYIMDSLDWCGIKFTEGLQQGGEHGPYRQSERKSIYREYAEKLVESGNAYYAFDTPEELEAMRNRLSAAKVAAPQYNSVTRNEMINSLTLSKDDVDGRLKNGEQYVIRIKIPRKEEIRFNDLVRGWVVVHSANLDDKVLFKGDGMPTYHLANVVDDHLMGVSHVIRGEEWLPSTPLHYLLYKYLGWLEEIPEFAHLPLLLRPDGNGKLSKRDGDRLGFPVFPLEWQDPDTGESSSGYKESGYFPEAVVNMLALLGWNPGTQQELFSMDQLVDSFRIEKVGKSGAKFDVEKVRWFNQQYLRMQRNEVLVDLFKPYLNNNGINADDKYIGQVCQLMKERAFFPEDMLEGIYLFRAPDGYDEKVLGKKWKEGSAAMIQKLAKCLGGVEPFTSSKIEEKFHDFLKIEKIGLGEVLPILRVLLTGIGSGPSVFEIADLLGRDETLLRIDSGLKAFSDWTIKD